MTVCFNTLHMYDCLGGERGCTPCVIMCLNTLYVYVCLGGERGWTPLFGRRREDEKNEVVWSKYHFIQSVSDLVARAKKSLLERECFQQRNSKFKQV